jgi:hypothetical protein
MRRSELPVLLVVGAIDDRGLALHAAARHGLRAVFAHGVADTAEALTTIEITAIALVPPFADAESFALAAALRRSAPSIPIAIVLGPSRVAPDEARVLWMADVAIPPALLVAVAEVGALASDDAPEMSWESLTADIVVDRLAG